MALLAPQGPTNFGQPLGNTSEITTPTTHTKPETTQSRQALPTEQLPPPDQKRSYATIMDKVRKWSVRFDGKKGPLVFIDRVEELSEVYDIPVDWMPRTMPELLKDGALTWFRNQNKHWSTWKLFKVDFLQFFLPIRYFEHLKDTIRERHQRSGECFNDYVLAMLDLMRPTDYTDEEKLGRIFRNSCQEIQLHIKRREFVTLNELMVLAGEYEEVIRQSRQKDIPNSPHQPLEPNRQLTTPANAVANNRQIDPRTACRRCGQEGHFRQECRNPPRKFCWTYGKDNVRTIECCR